VLIKTVTLIDGDPLASGLAGLVLGFKNGTVAFGGTEPFAKDDLGGAWWRFSLANGTYAIRASFADPSTPTSNTVNITWGSGSCPQTLPTPPVLTATAGPASIHLDWNAFVPPLANYPPLIGWAVTRLAGSTPGVGNVLAYVPASITEYEDNGTAHTTSPPSTVPGVTYFYRVAPLISGINSSAYQSNVASATITARDGFSLDTVRYRVA